tara:strand:- start:128 stop:367 length:240 start_codon:yes stop_codon:yes gene_type:complete
MVKKSSHALFIFFISPDPGFIASIPGHGTGHKKKFYFLAAAIFDHLISIRSYLRCVKIYFIFNGWCVKKSICENAIYDS